MIIGNPKEVGLNFDRFNFLLVIGTTDVSLIPGITVAGATPELPHFTPAADAEYLVKGRCEVIRGVPVTPNGIPTPALLTRASLSLTKGIVGVAVSGARVKPRSIPFIDLGGEPGKDIRKYSMDRQVVRQLLDKAVTLGEAMDVGSTLILAESIPGGTTTAMATLAALGYNSLGRMSSTSPQNPKSLKEGVVRLALRDLPQDTLGKLAKVSDPVLLALAGIAAGFKGKSVLAGGTQMVAAAAVLKELFGKRAVIATTKWILDDKSADMLGLASEVGVEVLASHVDLNRSRYEGLKFYERGYVKEGVGAGGAMLAALSSGFKEEEVLNRMDQEYELLIAKS